jgi:RNA polymerase sigma-70 factor (ECF subfamily)
VSPEQFEAVVADVWLPLQRYLRRRVDATTAEDVLGDVLLVMWRRRADLPADAALPWSYAVARGCLANAVRGEQRRLRLVNRLAAQPPPALNGDDDALDLALTSIPDADRELLRLWAWEGLAPREIAVVLDITPNAASIRLHRATKRLRNALAGKDDAPAGHRRHRQGEEAPR